MDYVITLTAMQSHGVLRHRGRPVYEEEEIIHFDLDNPDNATRIDIGSIAGNGDLQTVSIPIDCVRYLIAGLNQALFAIAATGSGA